MTPLNMSAAERAGFHVLRGFALERGAELIAACAAIADDAPWVRPQMRDGTPFRCDVTGAGAGVFWSAKGEAYRYIPRHPETAKPWPVLPDVATALALDACVACDELGPAHGFDSLLLNHYRAQAGESLGLHVDADEEDLSAPIVTVSLGADCEFMVERGGSLESVILSHGDVVVMADLARGWRHGVKRILPVMGSPLPHGERWCASVRSVR